MRKITSFNLRPRTRINNYRVLERIQRGCEGEAYKVEEVPTGIVRVLKLYRIHELESVRNLMHSAWYYERVRCTGHFPIYYHYGNWFADDGLECWFLVFEYVNGKSLKDVFGRCVEAEKELFFIELAKAVAEVHKLGFAVGDFFTLENVFWANKKIVFVDCNPGTFDETNTDFHNDCKNELMPLAKRIFGKTCPEEVKAIIGHIKTTEHFMRTTLSRIIKSTLTK